MDNRVITKMLRDSKIKKNRIEFLDFILLHKKKIFRTIKIVSITLFILIFLFKPSIPARVTYNIINAFKFEQYKSKEIYNSNTKILKEKQ